MFPLIPLIPTFMTTITTTISSIGAFITTYGPTIVKGINTVMQVIDVVGKVVNALAPTDRIEDLGGRALQAAEQGVQPEQFASYDDYLSHLRQMDYNPEQSSHSEIEKQLTGVAIASRAIEEKLDLPTTTVGILSCLIALNPIYFTDQRIQTWLDAGMDLTTVVRYFANDLGVSDSFKTEQQLIGVEKSTRQESDAVLERELEQVKTDLYNTENK